MATPIPARLSAHEGRRFAFTVGLALLALAALIRWRGATTLPAALALTGGALLVAGLIVPDRLGPVQSAWMTMAHGISRVTTPVFMSIVYFVTIVPIGFVMRALGHNTLRVPERSGGFWIERPPESRKSDLDRQF